MAIAELFWATLLLAGVTGNPNTEPRKTAEELIYPAEDQRWPIVEDALKKARRPAVAYLATEEEGTAALVAVQVTNRSTIGAVVSETRGISLNHGWVWVLGAGEGGIADLNNIEDPAAVYPLKLLVGYDAIGGRLYMNTGFDEPTLGDIYYQPPHSDDLWGLGIGYTAWFMRTKDQALNRFYKGRRPRNWKELGGQLQKGCIWDVDPAITEPSGRTDLTSRTWTQVTARSAFDVFDGNGDELVPCPPASP